PRQIAAVLALAGGENALEACRAAQRNQRRESSRRQRDDLAAQLAKALELAQAHRPAQAAQELDQLARRSDLDHAQPLGQFAARGDDGKRLARRRGLQQGRGSRPELRPRLEQHAARQTLLVEQAVEAPTKGPTEVAQALLVLQLALAALRLFARPLQLALGHQTPPVRVA